VPSGAQKPVNPADNPLVYNGAAITTPDVACEGEIYTFEAEAGAAATLQGNTCLVVGGIYGADAQETFYRVDFANTTANVTTYLDLLRNHHYKVCITDVNDPGLTDPKDAFNSHPVNIKATIIPWNDSKFINFVVDGQYFIGVSRGEFDCPASSATYTLSVVTDYPDGWVIEKVVDAGDADVAWLACGPTSGSNPAGDDITLQLQKNETGSDRVDFIHLTAGRLNYIVKVTQSNSESLSLLLTDSSNKEISMLEFVSAKDVQPAAQTFNLNWSPASFEVSASVTVISNPFAFVAGSDVISSGNVSDPLGATSYSIQPTAITTADLEPDPFHERLSIVVYAVSDGVSTATKTLILRQRTYNVVPVVNNFYLMDGSTQNSFAIRSNSPFTVKIKDNPGNVISNLSTTGTANVSAAGTPVYFDIIDDLSDPSLFQANVVVTIESPEGHFPEMDVTLNCASGIIQSKSNAYIVAPAGAGILIPVSRANESDLGIQLGASEIFTAELIWTDNSNGIANHSNIKLIRAVGTGSAGYVLVMPGSAEGNAVVAIRKGGQILWSWHIWVTNYTPTPSVKGFMDRNLGAIGNTPGAVGTFGLAYQWGRKDPFPMSAMIGSSVEPILYTANGGNFQVNAEVAPVGSPPTYNLGIATANPSTFYLTIYGISYNTDWYSISLGNYNDALWGPSKTGYDPCPIGWRVPSCSGSISPWDGLTNSNFPWDAVNLGRYNADYGGFYPASGWRFYYDNYFNGVGGSSCLWTATPLITTSPVRHEAYCLLLSNTSVSPMEGAGSHRAYGFSVRCVVDE
jgi:hypothetical protein